MNNITYRDEQVNEIAKLIDSMTVKGVEAAMTISRIINILNSPVAIAPIESEAEIVSEVEPEVLEEKVNDSN